MAGRWERLAVEAHYRKVIDFREDGGPYQRLREEIVFNRIEDELAMDVMELAHSWHASAAASDPWDPDGKTFEFHQKEVNKIYRDVGKLKLPWYKRWSLDDVNKLVGLIKQFYAQERDPEFQKWRAKVKKEMRDKIDRVKHEQQAVQEAGKALKQAQADREKRAKQAHERRKARTRRSSRG